MKHGIMVEKIEKNLQRKVDYDTWRNASYVK